MPSGDKKTIDCNISECIIFRNFIEEEGKPIIDYNTNSINQAYLVSPSARLVDFSTNLYGIFTLDDGLIEIIGERLEYYHQYCEPTETVIVPLFNQDFQRIENRKFWYIKVGVLEELEVVYPGAKNSTQFVAECKICHTPMRWNFWHFSIRWLIRPDEEKDFWLNEIPSNQQKKYIKKIVTELRSVLTFNAKLELHNEFETIPDSEYLTTA